MLGSKRSFSTPTSAIRNDSLHTKIQTHFLVLAANIHPIALPPTANMNSSALRTKQAPLKELYKTSPSSALLTLKSTGTLSSTSIACSLNSGPAIASAKSKIAGLHPAAGGEDPEISGELCSGDMLLEALVACAGVTLKAVATAMEIHIKDGEVRAEGDLDFRGTMGVDRSAPVGFVEIRMEFVLDTDAEQSKVEKLAQLTERYCVVLQTISQKPKISVTSSKKELGKVGG